MTARARTCAQNFPCALLFNEPLGRSLHRLPLPTPGGNLHNRPRSSRSSTAGNWKVDREVSPQPKPERRVEDAAVNLARSRSRSLVLRQQQQRITAARTD
ncbi:uncharacterized protein V6R79_001189 [Siganus canaliculatus]